jgi:hypothetical protein
MSPLLAGCTPKPPAPANSAELPPRLAARLFDQVGEMMSTLSEITGWRIRRAVPSQMLSKEKFRQFVETRMKQTSTREDLRVEELTLKMFGFVPQDFNLERETVDLVSEQAAAFYDYNKKCLFILDSTAQGGEQRVALVHELAHALADQQYPLGKYLRKGSPDDDGATARQAVMEGQATWLTWAYMSKRAGGKAEVPPSMLLDQKQSTPSTEFPIFSREPLYLRESLVFPYDEGMRFQEAVYRKLGIRAFDEVFKNPPLNTQHILHSQAYFSGQRPVNPQLPPLAAALGKEVKRFRMLAEGSVGELDHSILLRQFVGFRALFVGDFLCRFLSYRGGNCWLVMIKIVRNAACICFLICSGQGQNWHFLPT